MAHHHRHHHRRRRCRRNRCRRRRRRCVAVRVHRPGERSFFPLIERASVASHSAAFPSLHLHGLVNVQRLLAFLAIWRIGSAACNDEGIEDRERSTRGRMMEESMGDEMIRTVGRGPLKSSSIVGSPGGHHGDVLGVKGGGRGEARMRVSGVRMGRVRMRMRVRVARMRTHGGGGSRSRGRGSARVASERVVRGVRLHAMLPRGRGLLPFVSKEMSWCVSQDR
jgi:hypothetical protein